MYLCLLTENESMEYWEKQVMKLPIQSFHSVHWKAETMAKTTRQAENYSMDFLKRLEGNILKIKIKNNF